MEVLWILVAAVVVLGPWALGAVALVRANRALAEARRAAEAAAPLGTSLVAARPAAPPAPAAQAPAAAPPVAPTSAPLPAPERAAGMAGGAAAFEEKLALVVFSRAGAVAVLVGAAYFLKYAIDNAWLGPWGRIAGACLAGAAALGLGEALRARTRAAWIHALQGAGLALLFLAAFGSHALYGLVPAGVAFAAVASVALLGGALAVRHRAELLLGLALAGGLLAPVLLSTGEDRPFALFGYLLVLAGASLAVSARQGFRVVPWLALAGVAALGAGWYGRFFRVEPPPPLPDASVPVDEQMGKYFPLARRLVPLGAALAFSAAWLAMHRPLRRAGPRAGSDAWLAAALLFATAAPFAMVLDRPLLAGLALAGAGVLAAWLGAAAERPILAVAAEAIALGLLGLAAEERRPGADGAWIAAASLVAAAHLGSVAWAWLVEREPPGVERTAAAAAAGLGFAAFAIALTGESESVLRASLVAGAAVAELALGAGVLAVARARGSVLLGAALALLAGAAAFLFSGATVTVAWAALAAVAAVLGARERDPAWVGGACALLGAVVLRVLAVDVPSVPLATWRFLATAGAEGRLEPAFLANPRAIALAAAAAALLGSARAIGRALPGWRVVAAVLAALGWAAAVGLAVGEARDLAFVLPPPPAVGDVDAFVAYDTVVRRAGWQQAGELSAVTSLVLAACAALLVGAGFLFRDALHRWLGLGGFGLVVAKLLLSDVWLLSRLQQVAVFLGVGVLLLGAAFLYARLGGRIAALLQGDPPRGGGGAAVVLLLVAATPAAALDPSRFRVAREVEGVAAAGLHVVEADADLLRSSRAAAGSLGDVRLLGPGGEEVPWALRVAAEPAERAAEGTVVDPVVLPDGSVQAVVDLGPTPPRHGELRLDLDGEEFLRAVRVETSADGRTYGTLAEGGRVWAIRGLPGVRHTAVRHPASEARWVRVTLLAGAGDPPRIAGARAALGDAEPPPLRALALAAPAPRRSADGRATLLELDLDAPGLPVEAVELEVATPAFERRVEVLASTDAAHWTAAGGGAVWRAPPADEQLRVAAAPGGKRFVRLVVADGDSAPLVVRGVRVLWRPRELVFRAERPGPHLLLAGADVAPPEYDLAALLARSGEAAPVPARLGPPAPNPRFREAGARRPLSERYRVPLSVGLAVLFGALALWAVRLLRKGREHAAGG